MENTNPCLSANHLWLMDESGENKDHLPRFLFMGSSITFSFVSASTCSAFSSLLNKKMYSYLNNRRRQKHINALNLCFVLLLSSLLFFYLLGVHEIRWGSNDNSVRIWSRKTILESLSLTLPDRSIQPDLPKNDLMGLIGLNSNSTELLSNIWFKCQKNPWTSWQPAPYQYIHHAKQAPFWGNKTLQIPTPKFINMQLLIVIQIILLLRISCKNFS
jgi:hypothetical protein